MKTIRRESRKDKDKIKRGRAAVRKGKRAKEVLDLVRAKLEPIKEKVWATLMSQFVGGDKRPDLNIHATGNLHEQFFHAEIKHDETISLREAFMQAVRDCKEGTIPVAVVKRFREPRIAAIWLDDLLDLMLSFLKENTEPKQGGKK
jgi:hypothetical protein